MKGYNLPDSTGPNDPDAPWNQEEDMREPVYIAFCPYCRGRVTPMDDPPHEWYVCPKCGEIETQDVEMVDADVEMVDAREVDQ